MTSNVASPQRARAWAWLDLARAGNFPSVWSNVVAALLLSGAVVGEWPTMALMLLTLVAASLVYAGGTTLNDVADIGFDSIFKPERALPRGVVGRSTAGWVGSLELLLGLGLLITAGASAFTAAALGATIVLYDWVHKHWAGSVVLMAACRGLLALTLATLPGHQMRPAFIVWVVALFVYIVVLSTFARREHRPVSPAPTLGRLVGRLLAFIPLIDAIVLAAVGAWWPALICAAAVPAGRWAQRQAAST
jgi:4-hydroxybenzoate polyprenyltransferase